MRTLFVCLLVAGCGLAQQVFSPSPGGMVYVSSDPSGSCSVNYITVNSSSGAINGCVGGTWTAIGSGGGGASVTTGTSAPAGTCTSGALYVRTDMKQFYVCATTNTWVLSSYQSAAAASRPANCVAGQIFLATDTGALTYCSTPGSPGTWSTAGASIASTSNVLKGNGSGAAVAAAAGTDFATATNGTNGQGLTSNGSGGFGTPVTLAASATTDTTNAANIGSGVLAVARGGTGIGSGTSGGIPAYTALGTIASSGALPAGAMVVGGGAGAVPTAQSFVLTGGTGIQRAPECRYGTVDLSTVFTNSATQEVSILTSTPGAFRYDYVLMHESTQVAGSPTLTVSMGQSGVDTDLSGTALTLKVGGGQNYLYETPRPPLVGSGTYTAVLYFTSSTTLGNGSVGNFTGVVTWEACGKKVQP